jgi:hypothetical protein
MVTPAPRAASTGSLRVTPLIVVLIVFGVGMVLIGDILDLVIRVGGSTSGLIDGIRNVIYPDAEGNIFSWFSATVLAAVGIGFFLVALAMAGARRPAWPYIVLGALALALSADEAAYLHERLAIFAKELGLTTSFTYGWILLGIPIAIVVGLGVLWLARRLDRQLRIRLIIAGIVFLAGSLGGELVGGFLKKASGIDGDGLVMIYGLEILVEETLEILGAILAFRAVLLHLNISNGPEGLAFSLPEPDAKAKR